MKGRARTLEFMVQGGKRGGLHEKSQVLRHLPSMLASIPSTPRWASKEHFCLGIQPTFCLRSPGRRAFRKTQAHARQGDNSHLLKMAIQGGLYLVRQGMPVLLQEAGSGRMSLKFVGYACLGSGLLIFVSVLEFGTQDTYNMLHGYPIDLGHLESMSEEDKAKALAGLKAVEEEMRLLGPVTVLAGTAVPGYWTSGQTDPHTMKQYECVPVTDPVVLKSLKRCLEGNDVGAGGRDADKGQRYSRLELAQAWRIENRTLWGKFAAERLQTLATVQNLKDSRLRLRVASPHIRKGLLDASRHLRKFGGCDTKINEYYLFHGLGVCVCVCVFVCVCVCLCLYVPLIKPPLPYITSSPLCLLRGFAS